MSASNRPAEGHPVETDQAERSKSALVLAAFLAISAGVVAFATLVSEPELVGWYAAAEKSPLAIPAWLANTLWVVIQMIVSVAAWLVWREHRRRRVTAALSLYVTQLVLTSLWRPVLLSLYPSLGQTAIWLAAGIMALLILTVATMIREFWLVHRGAALSIIPFLVWTLYALSNNIFLGVLN